MRVKQWTPTIIAVAIILLMVPFAFAGKSGDSGAVPAANKTAAAGQSVEILRPDAFDDELGVSVLDTYVKSGGPKDLIISLSLECALWTENEVSTITAAGNDPAEDYSMSRAHIEIWVTIDGKVVSIGGDDDGRVTFCDRVQEQKLTLEDEQHGNWTMWSALSTTQATSFNWVTLDVGSGTHHIEVFADITADNVKGEFSAGAIGSRTLVIETTDFPNGTSF